MFHLFGDFFFFAVPSFIQNHICIRCEVPFLGPTDAFCLSYLLATGPEIGEDRRRDRLRAKHLRKDTNKTNNPKCFGDPSAAGFVLRKKSVKTGISYSFAGIVSHQWNDFSKMNFHVGMGMIRLAQNGSIGETADRFDLQNVYSCDLFWVIFGEFLQHFVHIEPVDKHAIGWFRDIILVYGILL